MKTIARIQCITAPRGDCDMVEQAARLCGAGCNWLQFRMKSGERQEKLEQGRRMADICRRRGAVFIVNDDIELAAQLGADGVHLGLQDESPRVARRILGSHAIIGGTCNTMEDIRQRHRQEVDYIGLGPYRFTSTKKQLSPLLGLQGIEEILRCCRLEKIAIPTVAIGGIQLEDVAALRRVGVHGVAVSSLLIDTTEPADLLNEITEKLQ